MKIKLIIFVFCLSWCYTNGAKLLVFSMSISKSHMISNGRIADALLEEGHDVTFLSVEAFIPTSEFSTTKLAKVLTLGRIPEPRKIFVKQMKKKFVEMAFQEPGIFDTYFSLSGFAHGLADVVEVALAEDQTAIEKLKAEKFDAIFYEQLTPHGAAFGEVFGIKTHFLINSCPLQEHITSIFGIPNPTGWVPSVGSLPISDKMTFYERARNELEHYFLTVGFSSLFPSVTTIFRRHFGAEFPAVLNIMREKVPLQFVAVNEFIDFPRPILHNIIYIGGLGMKAAKNDTLKEPFNSEMQKGKKGIVYFSLGSNCDSTSLPEVVKRNLIDAFAEFPDYHFIVKLEATDEWGIKYANSKANIFVCNWAPQAVLLRHPRLRLFHTHGGYNSLLEVAHSGVPVLLMPMMYDQIRNGRIVERNGWGKVLDKMELLKGNQKLVQLLHEMLTNEKYQKEAKRIQRLLETKPFSANEIFSKNIKFVLENGGKLPELRPASMDLNFITQHNIDVLVVFIAAALMALFFVLITIYYFIRFLCSFFVSKIPQKLNKKNN